jgi:hypothetical protein
MKAETEWAQQRMRLWAEYGRLTLARDAVKAQIEALEATADLARGVDAANAPKEPCAP